MRQQPYDENGRQRAIAAKYPGTCKVCHEGYEKRDPISRDSNGKWGHDVCAQSDIDRALREGER